ncbi:gp218 [Bacillus phage W.Ph.]|uniref:Gp218 n=1 Tax=Bacillus phage W.Ph. TaxID=764595 RepID=G9B1W9_9CAUD|nr:gp218 [Bacillus phage W.Ph.]ADH03364.1 gp218 [Bacillus phage W.Ph.]
MLTIETYRDGSYNDMVIITTERDNGNTVYGVTIFESRDRDIQYVQRAMLNEGQMLKLKYNISQMLDGKVKLEKELYATRQDRSKAVSVINSTKDRIGIAITPRHELSAITFMTHEQATELLEY